MEEEENIEPKPTIYCGEPEETQPLNNESADEMFSSNEPIPAAEQPSTLNLQSLTPDMETHAHHLHKAPGHGWKHYFFE